MLKVNDQDKTSLIDPLFATPGQKFWITILVLLAIIGFGGYMYIRQLMLGLGQTGMDRPVYWGTYMVNFIFLIGVSMAGTLISAALQLNKAEWRSPITRMAETLTVFGLLVATMQIFLDMGKPERGLSIFFYGRLQSPLLWDATSLTVYLLTSMFALFLQLLPDIALLRDNYPAKGPEWRKMLYTYLSLGWRGTREQWFRLEKAITVISILIIPIGISLHTVTSWIFSTTMQPGWNSTILGPYFVVGAIFSGIGMLFVVMALMRRLMKLEGYIKLRQFNNLSWLFIVMSVTWFYFTYTENLTIATEQGTAEFPALASKLWGEFAPVFWGMVALMFASLWILVVPKLIPEKARRFVLFQPRFAMASAGLAIVTLFFLSAPVATPLSASLLEIDNRTIAWILLIILFLGTGLGISLWLKKRIILVNLIAGIFVVVAMWMERWLIVVPTMTHPRLVPYTMYFPTLTEISLSLASAALLALLVMLFFKLFPVVSIWEVSEQRIIEDAKSKISIPKPEPSTKETPRRWGFRR